MELRHLRYFKVVAERLNFSRAAVELRVAQPALSRQVRALEEELGVKLFVREGGVQLTDAGRAFHAHTCRILAQVDVAAAEAREAAQGNAGQLIVCSEWRVAGPFLPGVIAAFRRRVPRAEVDLRDMRFHEQLEALRARRAHIGFVVRNVLGRAGDLESLLVWRAQLLVVLPADHRLASADAVALAELAQESWAVLSEDEAPGYRAYLTQLCRLAGFAPRFGPVSSTPEGLVGRVASGYAVALTLESNAPQRNRLVRVLPLDVAPLELCAVWHHADASPLLQTFLQIVREQAASADHDSRPPRRQTARSARPPRHGSSGSPQEAPQTSHRSQTGNREARQAARRSDGRDR